MVMHWLKDTKDNPLWYKHGGEATVLAYEDVDENFTLEDYHLDEKEPSVVCLYNMNGVKYEFYQSILLGWEHYG
jgi:serine/threonine protein phosphatase 1